MKLVLKGETCYRVTDYLVKDFLYGLVNERCRIVDIKVEIIREILNRVFRQSPVSDFLSHVQHFDQFTFDHSLRVAILSLLCGIHCEFNVRQLTELGQGGLLHDVGKIHVSKAILNKPGALAVEEFEHIKAHVLHGFEMLTDNGFPDLVAETVLQHHERFDGSGYPLGSSGEEITQFAGIVSAADTFDALTTDRVYRSAYGVSDTVEIIGQLAGRHFAPSVSKLFGDIFGGIFSQAGSVI